MSTNKVSSSTKLTVRFFGPMYADFKRQLGTYLLQRDAFLDRVIAQEIPYLREDLQGKVLSQAAHRFISSELKNLGRPDLNRTLIQQQVSIAVRPETAEALRAVVQDHNLVRDAFLNRLVALLRSSKRLLDALDLPHSVTSFRKDGTEDMPTSPLKTFEVTLADPFHYLRAACHERYQCGLYALPFPRKLQALSCYLSDEEVEGTESFKNRNQANEDCLAGLDIWESNLSPIKTKGV